VDAMPNPIEINQIKLTGGYLFEKESLVRAVTLPALYKSYEKTGRINAFKLSWRRGESGEPHIFWDSDVAKWIEGAAYTLQSGSDPELEGVIDGLIDDMEKGQTAEGYFNTYYLMVKRTDRFTVRNDHELYCAGHLMEAAVAYYRATGKRKMLDIMCRYADYIEKIFTDNGRRPDFMTPGHEEIELALVRLYEATGERRYLDLSKFFVDRRGISEDERCFNGWYGKEYAQDHLPVREQKTAEGHAVRALYLYAGMADMARLFDDDELRASCEKLFDDIINKKMHVTGGLGGSYHGESFSYDYDLPNELAYTETCASIAFIFFAQRMFLLTGEAKYMDALELMLYNTVPAGLSVSGDRFFYTNPLEMHPERRDYFLLRGKGQYAPEYERPDDFGCSCCPPNIIRMFSSIKKYMYHTGPGRIYVSLYGSSVFEHDAMMIEQVTDYPWSGAVNITVKLKESVKKTICFRAPSWCEDPRLTINGIETPAARADGYIKLERMWNDGDAVGLYFDMRVVELRAHPLVHYNANRIAVKRGPVVFCAESADNGSHIKSIIVKKKTDYRVSYRQDLLGGVAVIDCDAAVPLPDDNELYRTAAHTYVDKTLRLIPYSVWANRGRGEMSVWLLKETRVSE